jgi:hypothetical protein
MSDINLDFTVSNNSIDFTVQPNDITITPEEIQLTFAQGVLSIPGGSNTQLQYNNNGALGGIPNVTFNGSNISLGNVSTVKITGGTNGFVLQTDGTGNLDWTAQTGGGGNGSPGGSNTQIQYNDAGTFGGNAGFTFNEVTGNVAIPGAIAIAGNLSAANANVDTLYANFDIDAAGNLFSGNANLGNLAIASFFQGDGSALTNVTANFSAYAGNVTLGTQPNITSLGTLTNLTLGGTGTVQQIKEKVIANGTGSTGTINFDLLTSAIINKTSNASANWTLNFRGNSTTTLNSVLSNDESITCTYINKNGITAYVPNSITVDGAATTVVYSGNTGTVGSGTQNGYDQYTFNILKSAANTYVVFTSRTGFI